MRVNQGLILIEGQGSEPGAPARDLSARDLPRPMLEVAGRPFIEHVIAQLARFGVRDIVLVADHPKVRSRYDGARMFGADVSVLDAAGVNAERLEEICFIANGDVFFDADLLPLIHASRQPHWTASALLPKSGSTPGVYLARRDALLGTAQPGALGQAALARLVATPIHADGYFADIATPQGLHTAQAELAARRTRPTAFLDRDGTINVDRGWTHRAEDLVWIDNAPAAVRLLNRAGYYVVVVTNQGGVARGFYDEAAIDRLHEHMQSHLIAAGAHIDAFYHCPHHPEGVVKPFAIECLCRKPGIGMLEQAARDWPIERARSFMVGDRDGDMEAAAAFQIPGLRFDLQTQSLLDLISRQLAEKT